MPTKLEFKRDLPLSWPALPKWPLPIFCPAAVKQSNPTIIGMKWNADLVLKHKTVYLWGSTGTGKTYSAAALYRSSPVKPLWLSAPEDGGRMVQAQMRGTTYRSYANGCGGDYLTRDALIQWVARCGFLVLDDLGVGAITGGTTTMPAEYQAAIQSILDAASGYAVITSNIAPKDLAQSTNQRIASRCLGGLQLELTGRDQRLTGARSGRVEVGA